MTGGLQGPPFRKKQTPNHKKAYKNDYINAGVAMTDHVERFHAALVVLVGHRHVKQRLIEAFEDHLADIHEHDLPEPMQQSFADLRREMNEVAPLNGEGPIRASVRKMSLQEASDCAARIVGLHAKLARQDDDSKPDPPVDAGDEMRVPPFLVKSG